ncbi:GNAT family N-acetyltransferase [Helcococcus ovis]|uniref:GNAT family N-acetyltransferase n=1 Tax=Helcococcus ovis TaxID=72026 RepID=UPI0038B7B11E
MNADFKINGKIIETKRLIIRQFEQGDLDDFYEYASVDGVGQMAGWNPHENKEKSQEILNMFIEENKTFALFHRDDKKVIGSLGIEKYKRENELTEFNNYIGRELGFVLSKDYWGKGLMPEAVNAVINYLFNELNYDFLTSGYFIFNNQSKRVQEKCAFKPYRKLIIETRMGTKEDTILNLIINPNKNIKLNFSYPETLIYNN